MDLGLAEKPVLITASSAGLGLGIATELAREGARVMLMSRSEEALANAQVAIEEATGNRPKYVIGDMQQRADIEQAVATTVRQFGGLFGVVNNTGGPPAGPFKQFDDEQWEQAFHLTLLSYVRCIRAALPHLENGGGGRILNNTSSSIKAAIDNLLLSNVFRTAIVGLSKTLARELGRQGILVNVIGAGKIKTQRVDHLDGLAAQRQGISREDFQQQCQAAVPLGRYGNEAEFGRLAAFLCSPANTYVTGQSILVDGGAATAY